MAQREASVVWPDLQVLLAELRLQASHLRVASPRLLPQVDWLRPWRLLQTCGS